MKNNKKQLLALVAMLSCLSIGTFNTTTIQAMEIGNRGRIRDILDELQLLRIGLVQDNFSTDFNQVHQVTISSQDLTNLFYNMRKLPNREAIKNNLHLISACEDALKAFAPPSPLAATVKPTAWATIDRIFTLLKELKELVKAEKY